MGVVTERVASIVLHVTNERILPVQNIERTIWGELEVHGTEVFIAAHQQILAECCLPTGALILNLVLLYSKKADAVTENNVALYFVGKMPGRHNFQT